MSDKLYIVKFNKLKSADNVLLLTYSPFFNTFEGIGLAEKCFDLKKGVVFLSTTLFYENLLFR
jgi:hypothetical protein